jgi:hypothetical protein
MPHPPSYTVRTAKITGMLRWIALILWMSSESMVNGLHIPHYYWITFTSFHCFAILTNIPYPIIDNKMAILFMLSLLYTVLIPNGPKLSK